MVDFCSAGVYSYVYQQLYGVVCTRIGGALFGAEGGSFEGELRGIGLAVRTVEFGCDRSGCGACFGYSVSMLTL